MTTRNLGERLTCVIDDAHERCMIVAVDTVSEAAARIEVLEAALTKIDAIRNSIIGCQSVNWSEHIYPLVAALSEAGFEGEEYESARKNVGTLIEQIKVAEARLSTAWYDGFVYAITRQPWEDCYDWAALNGQDYARATIDEATALA